MCGKTPRRVCGVTCARAVYAAAAACAACVRRHEQMPRMCCMRVPRVVCVCVAARAVGMHASIAGRRSANGNGTIESMKKDPDTNQPEKNVGMSR